MTPPRYALRFFFDFGSDSCLWSSNDVTRERFGYPARIDDLPLPPALANQVRTLAKEYDTCIDWRNPGGPSPWTAAESAAFLNEADELLTCIREELGPSFLVAAEHRLTRDAPNRRNDFRPVEVLAGIVELASGVALSLWGCVTTIDHNASMAGLGALFFLLLGLAIALPGWFILRGRPGRLWWQVLPATILLVAGLQYLQH